MSALSTTPVSNKTQPIRVMVVDDSVVIRGLISRWLDALPDVEVVLTCRNGEDAVNKVAQADVDVIILDIEMPVMDGLTALPQLLKNAPGVRVLMASTLTSRNADISLKALKLGATDYVPKPESTRSGGAPEEFRKELTDKIRAIGRRRRPLARGAASSSAARPLAAPAPQFQEAAKPIVLQPASRSVPRVLAIGSSTGGPRALFDFLGALSPAISNVPVVITQHMPATFTSILAEHIAATAKRPCVEGASGMKLEPGKIYVAPGGFHMIFEAKGTDTVIKLDESEPVNFCRPSVDPMLDSLIALYGASVLTVILTGMGHDGREGARHVQERGGTVLAQDEETSVVWGMPGAVAQAGICHKVEPINELVGTVTRLIKGGVR